MIYVVLGMHKSGTTLISQILHHSGINMGDDIDTHVSYDQGNKYERDSTKMLNIEILSSYGMRSLHVTTPTTLWMTENQRVRMREIIRSCDERYADWGFKDPRTCLVYPLWASELPEHKIIAIYRSPDELWRRYRPRSIRRRPGEPYRAWKFAKRWCEYNANILTYLQNTQMGFLVLDYRRLMTAKTEFDRVQEFVGGELEDRRRIDLYRNRPRESFLIKFAMWLVYKQTGCRPEEIINQLEALGRKSVCGPCARRVKHSFRNDPQLL